MWPAAEGQRGVPDAAKPVGTVDGPLVFETFKADWEVFQPDGHAPSAWAEFGGVPTNPCAADLKTPGPGDFILASTSKFQNLGEAGFGKLVGPLVAQNKTYVRYTTTFNQSEFNQNSCGSIVPPGKSCENRGVAGRVHRREDVVDRHDRYSKSRALLHPQGLAHGLDDGALLATTVGLVGIHIVQKTAFPAPMDMVVVRAIDNVPQSTPPNAGPRHSTAETVRRCRIVNPIPFPPPETVPAALQRRPGEADQPFDA